MKCPWCQKYDGKKGDICIECFNVVETEHEAILRQHRMTPAQSSFIQSQFEREGERYLDSRINDNTYLGWTMPKTRTIESRIDDLKTELTILLGLMGELPLKAQTEVLNAHDCLMRAEAAMEEPVKTPKWFKAFLNRGISKA
jgi:hypothetical protein